ASGITNGSIFQLVFENATDTSTQTTGPITYSSTASILQNRIQSALDSLTLVGAGNTVVSAANASSATVTFQGTLGGNPGMNANSALGQNTMTATGGLVSVATTSAGFTEWNLSTTTDSVNNTTGLFGVTEVNVSGANLNQVSGSLILVTFVVKAS